MSTQRECYGHRPQDPIRDALRAITGEEPPDYVRGYTTTVPEELMDDLQGWAASHARPDWSTGIGTLDAADLLVSEAVGNANIPPDPDPAEARGSHERTPTRGELLALVERWEERAYGLLERAQRLERDGFSAYNLRAQRRLLLAQIAELRALLEATDGE